MKPIPPLEIQIRRALFDMGIRPTRKGYRYLLKTVRASSLRASIQYVLHEDLAAAGDS